MLVPHLIWLFNNEFVTITYGLNRSGLEQSNIIDHLQNPLIFLFKQIGIFIPFLIFSLVINKKSKFKINFKDKNFIFLLFINISPIILIFLTSAVTGSKIRTMWMTPFYLFFGVLFVYMLQSQINLKKINSFLFSFLFLFFLSPILYSYISITQTDKRTDYPGKEIALKAQVAWEKNFDKKIEFVTGDEWTAGNLSYHLKSRPKWEGFHKQ